MSQFFKLLLSVVDSLSIEKDLQLQDKMLKKRTDTIGFLEHDHQYAKYLTNFAFDAYRQETDGFANVNFIHIDGVIAATGTRNARIITSANTCDCRFFTSYGLPCKHIMKFRAHNELELFEPTICNNRWQKERLKTIAHHDYVLDDEPNVQVVGTQSQRQNRTVHSSNQKYRLAQKKCEAICTYLSELPENLFQEGLERLGVQLEQLKGLCNQGIVKSGF